MRVYSVVFSLSMRMSPAVDSWALAKLAPFSDKYLSTKVDSKIETEGLSGGKSI